MTRRRRRERTRWINLMRKRGLRWRGGQLWRYYRWKCDFVAFRFDACVHKVIDRAGVSG